MTGAIFVTGAEGAEFKATEFAPKSAVGKTASVEREEAVPFTSEDVLKDVGLEATNFPAVKDCAGAAFAKTATLDTSARPSRTGTTRFLFILFISYSPFCKRLSKLYCHAFDRTTPHYLECQKGALFYVMNIYSADSLVPPMNPALSRSVILLENGT